MLRDITKLRPVGIAADLQRHVVLIEMSTGEDSRRVEGPRRTQMKHRQKYEGIPERIELSPVCVTSSTTGR